MGCMCVQSFIILGICSTWLAHFISLYHNVWLWQGLFLHVNNIVYKKLKCSCTTCNGFQSLCKVSSPYLPGFWDTYACLNWITTRIIMKTDFLIKYNNIPIMWFKPFLGYMPFVMIQINLMCQMLDLIETESQTWMYGHNAGLSTTVLVFSSTMSEFPIRKAK